MITKLLCWFCDGAYRSEVVYKAKKTNSVTFQRFHCLTLDVGTGGVTGTISLDTCLATYFAEEVSQSVSRSVVAFLFHFVKEGLKYCIWLAFS